MISPAGITADNGTNKTWKSISNFYSTSGMATLWRRLISSGMSIGNSNIPIHLPLYRASLDLSHQFRQYIRSACKSPLASHQWAFAFTRHQSFIINSKQFHFDPPIHFTTLHGVITRHREIRAMPFNFNLSSRQPFT